MTENKPALSTMMLVHPIVERNAALGTLSDSHVICPDCFPETHFDGNLKTKRQDKTMNLIKKDTTEN
jgi:hypothetical protein